MAEPADAPTQTPEEQIRTPTRRRRAQSAAPQSSDMRTPADLQRVLGEQRRANENLAEAEADVQTGAREDLDALLAQGVADGTLPYGALQRYMARSAAGAGEVARAEGEERRSGQRWGPFDFTGLTDADAAGAARAFPDWFSDVMRAAGQWADENIPVNSPGLERRYAPTPRQFNPEEQAGEWQRAPFVEEVVVEGDPTFMQQVRGAMASAREGWDSLRDGVGRVLAPYVTNGPRGPGLDVLGMGEDLWRGPARRSEQAAQLRDQLRAEAQRLEEGGFAADAASVRELADRQALEAMLPFLLDYPALLTLPEFAAPGMTARGAAAVRNIAEAARTPTAASQARAALTMPRMPAGDAAPAPAPRMPAQEAAPAAQVPFAEAGAPSRQITVRLAAPFRGEVPITRAPTADDIAQMLRGQRSGGEINPSVGLGIADDGSVVAFPGARVSHDMLSAAGMPLSALARIDDPTQIDMVLAQLTGAAQRTPTRDFAADARMMGVTEETARRIHALRNRLNAGIGPEDTGPGILNQAMNWIRLRFGGQAQQQAATEAPSAMQRRVLDVRGRTGEPREIVINPSQEDILRMTRVPRGAEAWRHDTLRYMVDRDGNVYAASGADFIHDDIARALNERGLLPEGYQFEASASGGHGGAFRTGSLRRNGDTITSDHPDLFAPRRAAAPSETIRGAPQGVDSPQPPVPSRPDSTLSAGVDPTRRAHAPTQTQQSWPTDPSRWQEVINTHPWINSPSRAQLVIMASARDANGRFIYGLDDIAGATRYSPGSTKVNMARARNAGVPIPERPSGRGGPTREPGGSQLNAIVRVLEQAQRSGEHLTNAQIADRLVDTIMTADNVKSVLSQARTGYAMRNIPDDLLARFRAVDAKRQAHRANAGVDPADIAPWLATGGYLTALGVASQQGQGSIDAVRRYLESANQPAQSQ